jgi:hypothetical protein
MTWLLGIAVLIAVVVVITVASGWSKPAPPAPLWDVPRISQTFTAIVGSLAGFSVACATFLAGQAAIRGAETFELVIAMFLIAFLILISCAMGFASVPTATASAGREVEISRLQEDIYQIAVLGYALGISVAWLALRPLLLAIGLTRAADLFTVLLFVAVVGSGARTSMALRRSQGMGRSTRAILLVLAIGAPLAYRAATLTFAPTLWPGENGAFYFTIGAFILGAMAFGLQTFLVSEYDQPIVERWRSVSHRVLLGLASATIVVITLMWLGVAAA